MRCSINRQGSAERRLATDHGGENVADPLSTLLRRVSQKQATLPAEKADFKCMCGNEGGVGRRCARRPHLILARSRMMITFIVPLARQLRLVWHTTTTTSILEHSAAADVWRKRDAFLESKRSICSRNKTSGLWVVWLFRMIGGMVTMQRCTRQGSFFDRIIII